MENDTEKLRLAEIRLRRTLDAAYHALLEMTGAMGIPEKRRFALIEEFMGNVIFCAENNVPVDYVRSADGK